MRDRIAIVGPGRVGVALGSALWKVGAVEALTYYGRRPEPPAYSLFHEDSVRYLYGLAPPGEGTTAVFLAVPDAAVAGVARELAALGSVPAECAAFHLSGVLAVEVLEPLHAAGYRVGSVHPLQAIADPELGAELLRGSSYAVAGEPEARAVARRLLLALDGRIITVTERMRPLYHAAAVMASSHVAAILAVASRLLEEAGVRAEDALPALLPLVRGTLENLRRFEPGMALTGPIVRGDVDTVRLHLRMLPERERALYCALGRSVLELAARAGLDEASVLALQTLLEESR